MKCLKCALWVCAVGFLAAVPFVFLPWGMINQGLLWFGVDPLPFAPIVVYLLRSSCVAFGLIGVFFVFLARDPVRYLPLVFLSAWGLGFMGVTCVAVGSSLSLPLFVYLGDASFGFIFGALIGVLAFRLRRQAAGK